jgi:pimeloyl-ACP methyl ester carboxylesterase
VKLESDGGGDGPRLLVLLHGLGATRHVWHPLLASGRWHGSWLAPDLRGHGASPHTTSYGLGQHAADVAERIQSAGACEEVVILGHSMGGAVALALASGCFGVQPARVFGLGTKVAWSDDELGGMRKMAATPARNFPTKDEAIGRYLKVSGLAGLIAPGSTEAAAGVAQTESGWRLAFDPATASIGPPPMRELLAAARAPIHLARGETDALVTREQLAAFDADAADLRGGHNVMVENPGAVWDWLESRGA